MAARAKKPKPKPKPKPRQKKTLLKRKRPASARGKAVSIHADVSRSRLRVYMPRTRKPRVQRRLVAPKVDWTKQDQAKWDRMRSSGSLPSGAANLRLGTHTRFK
jgi:hypothetical protein